MSVADAILSTSFHCMICLLWFKFRPTKFFSRFGALLKDLTDSPTPSLPLENVRHILEYRNLSKLFYYRKAFELLGWYVIVKEIISKFLVVFGFLKTSRGTAVDVNMVASISHLGHFRSANLIFQFFTSLFFFTFWFSTMVHIPLPKDNIFA